MVGRARMPLEKQILCVKWGSLYGPEYVNRLYDMVARNITGAFKVICLTDSFDGIRPEVTCLALPELGVPHPERTHGKWKKVVLWGRELCGLQGVALFIDLDSVIVGNLDPYFTHGSPDDVILARNWARPFARLGQTSVFRFPIGRNSHILDNFRADPQGIADKFHFEQHYMTHAVAGGIKFWPEAWTRHFRLHCLGGVITRYFRPARIPPGARIVTFPGGPKPEHVAEGRWDENCPPYAGPMAHLKRTFKRAERVHPSPIKHLKRFVMPVSWAVALDDATSGKPGASR
jgi:hypothetical protein